MFALALYAGEGSNRDGSVIFANTNPMLVAVFLRWLRNDFDLDESRFRVRLYLHADLDLDAAQRHWSEVTGIPIDQFRTPYRAVVDATMRTNRHAYGCPSVIYHSRLVHRRVMARIAAVGSVRANPG